jgi:hypothetical protein
MTELHIASTTQGVLLLALTYLGFKLSLMTKDCIVKPGYRKYLPIVLTIFYAYIQLTRWVLKHLSGGL